MEPPSESELDRARERLGSCHGEIQTIHAEAATLLGNAKVRWYGNLKRESCSLRERLGAVEIKLRGIQLLGVLGKRLEAAVEMGRCEAKLAVQALEAEVERRASKRLQVARCLFAAAFIVFFAVCGMLAVRMR
jgi:hypothetical protein